MFKLKESNTQRHNLFLFFTFPTNLKKKVALFYTKAILYSVLCSIISVFISFKMSLLDTVVVNKLKDTPFFQGTTKT